MDSAKMCQIMSSGCLLLLLILLGDSTEACKCVLTHPQTTYCKADFVIRARFLGRDLESEWWSRYEIQITQVYKGSAATQKLRFLHTPRPGKVIEGLCGYIHNAPLPGEDYVIIGKLKDNRATIDSCSFIQPWARLSPEHRRGISLDFSKGCSCTIVPCLTMPCSVDSSARCLWTDVDQMLDGNQAKSLTCLPGSGKPGFCTWQSLKG